MPILQHVRTISCRLTLSARTVIDVKVGIPREVKNNEFRVAITPAGVHELVRDGHQVVVEKGAGAGSSIPDAEYTAAGAAILRHRRRGVGRRRPAAEGQGAGRRGVPPAAQGPDPLHLPAPRRLPRVHRRAAGVRHHRHRLRDGRDRRPPAAAARPDVRGGRAARPAGRRLPPDALGRRPRRAARRRARRAAPAGPSSSAPASPAGTPPPSRSAWASTSPCSTRTSTSCARPTRSSATGCRPSPPTPSSWSGPCSTPTWWSARC